MSRTERLLQLMQMLRRQRQPVAAQALAGQLGISLRSFYRDIATLRSQGAHIEGAPGIGYVLRPGYTLPPLMFNAEEIEALVLGARWVQRNGDAELAQAAQDAIAKIASMLPAAARRTLEHHTLLVATATPPPPALADAAAQVRSAIRTQCKLRLDYRDAHDGITARTVWPFAIGFFEQARVLAAWCELRGDFRHFRLDRIQALTRLPETFPRHRMDLLRQWQQQLCITPSA